MRNTGLLDDAATPSCVLPPTTYLVRPNVIGVLASCDEPRNLRMDTLVGHSRRNSDQTRHKRPVTTSEQESAAEHKQCQPDEYPAQDEAAHGAEPMSTLQDEAPWQTPTNQFNSYTYRLPRFRQRWATLRTSPRLAGAAPSRPMVHRSAWPACPRRSPATNRTARAHPSRCRSASRPSPDTAPPA